MVVQVIYPDNEEEIETNNISDNLTVMREFNEYSEYNIPFSAGIPVGTTNTDLYLYLDTHSKEKIDEYI